MGIPITPVAPQDDQVAGFSPEPDERAADLEPDADVNHVPATLAASPEMDAVAFASRLRREKLSPYFEEFLRWAAEEPDPQDLPRVVALEGRSVEIGSWERATLGEARETHGRNADRALSLLAEGVALQARLSELLERFDHGPMPRPSELPVFLDGLITDVAVGIALQEELQHEMNRLIGSGRLADAKHLSAFRAKVVQCVSELKERIGEDEIAEAERRAVRLSPERPSAAPSSLPELEEDDPDAPSWATYRDREDDAELPPRPSQHPAEAAPAQPVQAEPRARIRPLVLVLAALVVVYGIVNFPRLETPEFTVLTLEHFSHLETVRSVTARPPSLFVVLDRQRWQAASVDERRELLQEMGRIAGEAGYNGIHARTRDGAPVGQWMKTTGVQLHGRPLGAT
jgi:hypothetical protein